MTNLPNPVTSMQEEGWNSAFNIGVETLKRAERRWQLVALVIDGQEMPVWPLIRSATSNMPSDRTNRHSTRMGVGLETMKQLLTVAEAANTLNLSETTIRALCAKRKIRHERHGIGRGAIRIPPDAVEEYRASVTVETIGEKAKPVPIPIRKKLRNLSRG